MVDVLVPLAVIEVGEAVMVEVAALAVPGMKETISLSVIDTPPTVPVIVDVPVVVAEVKVALYVPLLLSAIVDSVPSVLLNVTVAPPLVRLFPLASFN